MNDTLIAIVPTYQNARTIIQVVTDLRDLALDILVVIDGSNDDTHVLLQPIAAQDHKVNILFLAQNQGKAAALAEGFNWALTKGYTHALTIDADGQHAITDVPNLCRASKENPSALILGQRSPTKNTPFKSLFGRYLANTVIFLLTLKKFSDSQSGLRIYPLKLWQDWGCGQRIGTARYGMESEVLIRAGWAKADVVGVPIETIYQAEDQRVSHFRPIKDTWHILLGGVIISLEKLLPHLANTLPIGIFLWTEYNNRNLADTQPEYAGIQRAILFGGIAAIVTQFLITKQRWKWHAIWLPFHAFLIFGALSVIGYKTNVMAGHLFHVEMRQSALLVWYAICWAIGAFFHWQALAPTCTRRWMMACAAVILSPLSYAYSGDTSFNMLTAGTLPVVLLVGLYHLLQKLPYESK